MKPAIEALLYSSQKVRSKVFEWFRHYLNSPFIKKEQKNEIVSCIQNFIETLVEINLDEAQELIAKYLDASEPKVIKSLKKHPEIQLNILEKSISQQRAMSQPIKDTLLVLYFKVLCKTRPKQVIDELKSYYYPSDPCLRVCEKFKLKEPLAFLQGKIGETKKSFQLYKELFMEQVKISVEKITKTGIFSRPHIVSLISFDLDLLDGIRRNSTPQFVPKPFGSQRTPQQTR